MSLEAIVQFLTIRSPEGALQGRYQNGDNLNTIVYGGQNYAYLSFIYNGATKSRTGDNLVGGLAMSTNKISMNLASQAVQADWAVQVETVLVDPETLAPSRLLSLELWIATSLSYDPVTLEVELSSAIDAIGLNAPNKVLLSSAVGGLPLTSSISNG